MRKKSASTSVGQELVSGLTEIRDALRSRDHRKLTIRMVAISAVRQFDAKAVKRLRLKLEVSQAVFAELMGVSKKLVEHWESGLRKPSPMACRLFNAVARHPEQFIHPTRSSAA